MTTPEPTEPLSGEVLARKRAMLPMLVDLQRERELHRRSRRAVVPALALGVALVGSWWLLRTSPATSAKPRHPQIAIEQGGSHIDIEVVQAAPRPLQLEVISEDQLIAELHQLGLPSGIARFENRIMIVSR